MSGAFLSCLVLAAGASSRFGRPKQLLPFRGKTLLGWTVSQFEACSALDEVVVVLGNFADEIRQAVTFGRSKIVVNPAPAQGCSASYRAGIAACDPRVDAIVVLLGDQPGVDAGVVEQVAGAWRRDGGKIVLASYRGERGHPMIFSRELFDQMIVLHGDKAVWKLVDQHQEWVKEVPVDRERPKDINTQEDYEALLSAEP